MKNILLKWCLDIQTERRMVFKYFLKENDILLSYNRKRQFVGKLERSSIVILLV